MERVRGAVSEGGTASERRAGRRRGDRIVGASRATQQVVEQVGVEDDDALEEGLTGGHFAPGLDLEERRLLVRAHLALPIAEALQPARDGLLGVDLHPDGKGYVNGMAGTIGTIVSGAIVDGHPIAAPTAEGRTLTGIDVLEQDGFRQLEGKRVGLITNQTGVDWSDIHRRLFDGPDAWFYVSASAG